MSQTYYNLYIQSILNLVETIVIKSDDAAETINTFISNIYGADQVDVGDKSSWRYYKNICGQYHFSDDPIFITSIDTLQTIRFTTENLITHTATRKAYQYGTRNYNELVSLYPDQEMLILGVLYPADMQKAIAAKDGAILSYPPDLVESNEYNLIANIEEWIRVYKARWFNQQFGVTDSLYFTTHLGLLYLNLVPLIINLRLKACKTNEAHSYHVKQYLASHGMIDVYLDAMTKKQALFFYRNIAYIERNNGKREIFTWLVEHIMTERKLPLGEMVMKHDVSVMPDAIVPVVGFDKKPINVSFNANDKSKYSLVEIFDKESVLTLGNPEFIEQKSEDIRSVLTNSLSSVVMTKILDSSLVDYSEDTPHTLHDIALNHWLSLSANGTYSVFVVFKDPKTGRQISISCKDAFVYFTYCFQRAVGEDIINVPTHYANRVVRQPKASVADLLSVVDTKYITARNAQDVLDMQPFVGRLLSVEAFTEQMQEIFLGAQKQLRYVAAQENLMRHGYMKNMVARSYCDKICTLVPANTNMQTWLVSKNLPDNDFSDSEYLDIYKQLFEVVTGIDLDSSARIKALQNSMVSLLGQLSSYSVQFTKEVTGSNLKQLNGAAIRIGDVANKGTSVEEINDIHVDVLETFYNTNAIIEVDSNTPYIRAVNKSAGKQSEHLEITVKTSIATNGLRQFRDFSIGSLSGGVSWADPLRNNPNDNGFLGFNDPIILANGNRLKSIYCDCFEAPISPRIDITSTVVLKPFVLFGREINLTAFVPSATVYVFKQFKLKGGEVAVGQFSLSGDTTPVELGASGPTP